MAGPMKIFSPKKPFDTYKWRWLHFQPTESLLKPPIFLGALRAFGRHQGKSTGDPNLLNELSTVQEETESPVNLVRTPDRNLIRNSGQYWKGTGLLSRTGGMVELTHLGHRVASGSVTQDEFCWLMVQETVLPNPLTYSENEMRKWHNAKLKIRPFKLILEILVGLCRDRGPESAFLTVRELTQVVIPLAGSQATSNIIVAALLRNRDGQLNVDSWPNCIPQANDKRLAREFLLFLHNFKICTQTPDHSGDEHRYYLESGIDVQIPSLILQETGLTNFSASATEDSLKALRTSVLVSVSGRERRVSSQLARPSQMKFRREVLAAFQQRCLITKEGLADVLEAAHIVPVEHGGVDAVKNGLCLRRDVHRLFDLGHLRILPQGALFLSDAAKSSLSYTGLPSSVNFPSSVGREMLEWRSKYL